MLKDPHKTITLVDLYKMLTSSKDIKDGKAFDSSLLMRISIEAAFNNMAENCSEALELFFIVSMFPGGIQVKALNQIWSLLKSAKN